MEYMAGYYRQQEESTALLLQHYIYQGIPLCLGCICGGGDSEAGMRGGRITRQLLEGFRRVSMPKAVRRPEKFLTEMERRFMQICEDDLAANAFWLSGILCVENKFLIYSVGNVKNSLCNIGFGRPKLHEVKGTAGTGNARMQVQRGTMEAGIGILLASDSFYRQLSQDELEKCLDVKSIKDPIQTQKRIQELGCAAEMRGGRDMAAILLEVREGAPR